jgi:hypothetical protein
MIRKASNNRNTLVVLTIALVLSLIIVSTLTNYLSQSNFVINTDTNTNQIPKQSSPATNLTGINETDRSNATNFYNNNSSTPINTRPISLEPLNPFTNKQLNPPRIFSASLNTAPISTDPLKFSTYTYCGYPVQQTEATKLVFSFPNNTNQGQIAGSDAITLDTYTIQTINFDAMFITPKTNALGFDEMAIFATSDTTIYKGTEIGIRLDLSDGYIYGYIQEPNGYYGEVNFQMLKLWPNDGMTHHYTIIMQVAEVSFYIDGTNYGYLNFASSTDYSSLNFSILAVVHRFSDDWDSVGDNMIVENFYLNQQ